MNVMLYVYLCIQWQRDEIFLDTKLFLIGEFVNLRNPICLLNLFSLDILIDHGLKSQT